MFKFVVTVYIFSRQNPVQEPKVHEEKDNKKKQATMLSKAAKERKYCTLSTRPWGLIPENSWVTMKTKVLAKLSPGVTATFIGAIYDSLGLKPWSRLPKGIVPKHLAWLFLHWIVESEEFAVYGHGGALPSNLSKSYVRKGLDYVANESNAFVEEMLRLPPPEEMQERAERKLEELGLEPPCSELKATWYLGDGKHYVMVKPDGEAVIPPDPVEAEKRREKNQKAWGEDVCVDGNTYAKVSWKPKTKGRICLAHQGFYTIDGDCIGYTPATWCAAPDKVQIRRWIEPVEKMLEKWLRVREKEQRKESKYLSVGALDGGYLDKELCERIGWVISTPDNVIQALPAQQRLFILKVSNFVHSFFYSFCFVISFLLPIIFHIGQ